MFTSAKLRSLAAAALLAVSGVQAAQNSLTQISGISPNPNNVGFYLYKPSKLASPLPLIVAIHFCTGSAQNYFSSTQYANLADTYGYVVIYPDSPRSGKCFDVASTATLTHNGGGDSQGIASAIKYAISNLGVDAGRVYVTGTSSGAMMTNVMAGSYPDLFQAASAYSGVPFGCFAGPSDWNSQCANGQLSKTAQQWGDQVRAAYPGYTGARPRMMLWHGTADTTLYYQNYGQEILEWTNVFNVSSTAQTTAQNNPQSGYTKTTYGSNVLGYSAQGVGHTVPVHETIDLAWFGITGTSPAGPPAPGEGSTTTPPVTTPPVTTPPVTTPPVTTPPVTTPPVTTPPVTTPPVTTPPSCTQAKYGQCGGQGYTGCTTCASGSTCKYSNPYYSQCL